jgi:hypothetical protein
MLSALLPHSMADNIIWPGIVQAAAQNTPAVIRATDNAGVYTLLVNGLWTPADIANLALFNHYKPAITPACCFESNGGAATAANGVVGYAAPLYGSPLSASELVLKPTLRTNGLEFDALGTQLLTLSSAINVGAITIYAAVLAASGANFPIIGDSSASGSISVSGGGVSVMDDGFGTIASTSITTDAVGLVRFSLSAIGGSYSIAATGTAESSGSSGASAMTLQTIGSAAGAFVSNDSTANRSAALIVVSRNIVFGSAEDLLIRGWLTTNTGATL